MRLIASCPDHLGILARVANVIAEQGGNITEANQFEDRRSRTFFMRYSFDLSASDTAVEKFEESFAPLAGELQMDWRVSNAAQRKRVVFLVSKFDHCLAYLLHRWKVGDLQIDIPCVISNHEKLRDLVEWYDIPYHYVPVPKEADAKTSCL